MPVIKASGYRAEDGTPIFLPSSIGEVPAITGVFSTAANDCSMLVKVHEAGAPAGAMTFRFRLNVAMFAGDRFTLCCGGFSCKDTTAKIVEPRPPQISPEAVWSPLNSLLVLNVTDDIAINQSLTVLVEGLYLPVSSKVLPYPNVVVTAVEGRKLQAITPTFQLSTPTTVFARGVVKKMFFSVLETHAGEFSGTVTLNFRISCDLNPGDVLSFSLPGYHRSNVKGETKTAPVKASVPAHFCSYGKWDTRNEYVLSFRVNRMVNAMQEIHLEFTEVRNPLESKFLPYQEIGLVAFKSTGEKFSDVIHTTVAKPIVGEFTSTKLTIEDAVAGQHAGRMHFDIQV